MELSGKALTLTDVAAVAQDGDAVKISPLAVPRVLASRKVVEEIIARDAVV
jgi:histidine ammonia-lyase